ncbi:MAG: hypothetical protein ACK5LL_04750 [Suipraeoptans sp.]
MKIRIAYIKSELNTVQSIIEHIKGRFADTKVKETAPKDGYLHTVLTIKKPLNTTK